MIGERPDCMECKHYNAFDVEKFSCKAFPDGIPEKIIMGEKHLTPTQGQNNEIVFEQFIFRKRTKETS
jgi:hypothetical protein